MKNMNPYQQNHVQDGKMLTSCAAPDTDFPQEQQSPRSHSLLVPRHMPTGSGGVLLVPVGCILSHSADHRKFHLHKLRGIEYGSTTIHRQLGSWLACRFQNHSWSTFVLLLLRPCWLRVPWLSDRNVALTLASLLG